MRPTRLWNETRACWDLAYALDFTGPAATLSLLSDEPVHPRFHAEAARGGVTVLVQVDDTDDDLRFLMEA